MFTQIKMYLKLGFVLDCEFLFVEQVPHVQQARQLPARLQGATAEIFTQFLRSNLLVRHASSAVCLLLRQQECCGTLETTCAVFSAPRPTQTNPQPAGYVGRCAAATLGKPAQAGEATNTSAFYSALSY